ncbi:hypothetical protein C8Q74DRAFT_1188007 [Fomes fomentarius]|nr:hypothetical protein C8Q74DRAFT_1188007 [Fomes fomentarius]
MTEFKFPLLGALRATLAERPPFCSGTLELPEDNFELYYGQASARYVNLCDTSPERLHALKALADASEAAWFGRNTETVLDETYRKAGKMDAENFMLRFDVERSGLLNIVHTGLLSGKKEGGDTRAELYKLNVYGESAFFKPHRDTPKSDTMFGSLVVIFPTPHQGGTIVLRHQGQEWTIDAAELLFNQGPPNKIVYVAFFSDVEHEILPVTSGHRVTVTYNLYWSRPDPAVLPKGLTMLHPTHSSTRRVRDVLAALLDDSQFLPGGGTLGFELRHRYPFPKSWQGSDPDPLDQLHNGWLKGGDWALYNACKELGLKPLLRLVYDGVVGCIILDEMLDCEGRHMVGNDEDLLAEGGRVVIEGGFASSSDKIESQLDEARNLYGDDVATSVVHWVTSRAITQRWYIQSGVYMTYGNEASVEYLYAPCLVVEVGPLGKKFEKEA